VQLSALSLKLPYPKHEVSNRIEKSEEMQHINPVSKGIAIVKSKNMIQQH
jgi:hypothetical protein